MKDSTIKMDRVNDTLDGFIHCALGWIYAIELG